MSHYAIIGGMYLPFVTNTIIKMVGARHKGIGSAFIEACQTAAILLTAIISAVLTLSAQWALVLILCLYILATITQKRAEGIKLHSGIQEHK